jgi:type II secretion system protein N
MKGLRIAGYVGWALVFFVVGLYLTFPMNMIKDTVVGQIEDQLGKGKQGPYGVDPHVSIADLSLWRVGVAAKGVSITLPSRDPDPGPTIDLDKLKVSVSVLSLLTKNKTVQFDADLYGGSTDGHVSVDPIGNVLDANIDVDSVDLSKVPITLQKFGVPIGGKLNSRIRLDLGPEPEKKGEGTIKLDVKGASVGPGNLKLLAMFGGLELPQADLGNLTADILVKQGQGEITTMKLDGKDIQAEVVGSLGMKGKVATTRVDTDGWFNISKDFMDKAKLSILNGFLSTSKDDDGRFHFSIKGTANALMPRMATDGGKSAKRATKPG